MLAAVSKTCGTCTFADLVWEAPCNTCTRVFQGKSRIISEALKDNYSVLLKGETVISEDDTQVYLGDGGDTANGDVTDIEPDIKETVASDGGVEARAMRAKFAMDGLGEECAECAHQYFIEEAGDVDCDCEDVEQCAKWFG